MPLVRQKATIFSITINYQELAAIQNPYRYFCISVVLTLQYFWPAEAALNIVHSKSHSEPNLPSTEVNGLNPK